MPELAIDEPGSPELLAPELAAVDSVNWLDMLAEGVPLPPEPDADDDSVGWLGMLSVGTEGSSVDSVGGIDEETDDDDSVDSVTEPPEPEDIPLDPPPWGGVPVAQTGI